MAMNLKPYIVYCLLCFPIIFLWYHLVAYSEQSSNQLRVARPTHHFNELKEILNCNDREYFLEILQNGNFWVLKNFIQAEHGSLRCYETVTYTTHTEFTFLENVGPLVDRWRAPISLAIFAPGTDFELALQSIKYIQKCLPQSDLIRKYVTFHIYFEYHDFPNTTLNFNDKLYLKYSNCIDQPPYQTVKPQDTYRIKQKLVYPVNKGRNIARDAALTHFLLPSDIELYPNPGLANDFLHMIKRNADQLSTNVPRVYPIAIFEIDKDTPLPDVKSQLIPLLKSKKAFPFHAKICWYCHSIPNYTHWLKTDESATFDVFNVAKRTGKFANWEPIFIGTRYDPRYDERLSWEGMRDKMTQGYALCAWDYEFHILNNAFLIHKPGIKREKMFPSRKRQVYETNKLIAKYIHPELKAIHGERKGCHV